MYIAVEHKGNKLHVASTCCFRVVSFDKLLSRSCSCAEALINVDTVKCFVDHFVPLRHVRRQWALLSFHSVCLSVGHSATYSLSRLIDHNPCRLSLFGSPVCHTFGARGKICKISPIAYSCHCERDASCHMTCLLISQHTTCSSPFITHSRNVTYFLVKVTVISSGCVFTGGGALACQQENFG